MTDCGALNSEPLDDESQVLLDGLLRELEENPPLNCPVTFHWQGDEEQANSVNVQLQVHAILMRRRHPWLTFDALDSIIFHHDYSQALRDVSEKAGRPCAATSEPSGIGIAMVVHLDEKCVLVLDAGVALGIAASEVQADQDLCFDIAMHELCHVHDYGRKRRLLAHEFLKRKVVGLERHTFTAAEAAWSEYFANRYSTSALSSPDMYPKYLAEVVPDVVRAIKDAITSYRTHHQLDQVTATCEQKVHFLFQCFGYAAGRVVANETSLQEVAPESCTAIRNAGLDDIWGAVFTELQRLDTCRDEWTSFDELKPLMGLIISTYSLLGLHYREIDDQILVDIPYAPDTMPLV